MDNDFLVTKVEVAEIGRSTGAGADLDKTTINIIFIKL